METTMNSSGVITPVVRDRDFNDMKELCIEYATSIDFEMDYQQLLRESASMKEIYKMPKGAGFLLKSDNKSVGCIGLRKVDYNTVEIRKFYVRPSKSLLKWSKNLLEVAIDWAMQSNYKKIRVDPENTHPFMKKLFNESNFREKLIQDENTEVLVRSLEKLLVSVPEYYQY
jgi:hypothetical protein